MPAYDEVIERLLDAEQELVSMWVAMDPGYEEQTWDLEDELLTTKRSAPAGFDWEALNLPSTFTALPLRKVSEAAQAMADRFARRQVLRRDDYIIDGLGPTSTYMVSDTDGSARTWPALRITVADAGSGPRVVRLDLPCTSCYATGGPDTTGCGYTGPTGDGCDSGWLYRGGVIMSLGAPQETARLVEPADARWHAWYRR